MRIETCFNGYLIVRGKEREHYFCFFVDGDRSCWTSKAPWEARTFSKKEDAEEALSELKYRQKLRKTFVPDSPQTTKNSENIDDSSNKGIA